MSPTKRRGRGEGGLYQRGSDGLWVGVVDLGYIDGKRKRKTVTARKKADLVLKLNTLRTRLAACKVGDGSTLTSAWLTYWLNDISTNRESTKATYRGYIKNWVDPHIGHLRVDKVQPEHIRSLMVKMEKAGRAPNTRHQVHAVLSTAFGLAFKEGKVAIDPTATVDAPSVAGSATHGRLTTDDAQKVLRHLLTLPLRERTRWAGAILLGIRQGEALGLDWDHVDLAAGTIHIERAQTRVKGVGLVLDDVKSKSSNRVLPIDGMPGFVRMLTDYRNETGGTGLLWGPLDNKADWKQWRAILKAAGVPAATVHAARGTTASMLEEMGYPPSVIGQIMGHTPGSRVTEKHYIRSDDDSRGRALGSLDKLLESPKETP